jgi:hypothetical protein
MRRNAIRQWPIRNARFLSRSGPAFPLAICTLLLLCAPLSGQDPGEVQPLKPGAMAPSGVHFQTLDGGKVELSQLILDSPVALVFFRGGW